MTIDKNLYLITGSYDRTPFQVEVRSEKDLLEKIVLLKAQDASYKIWVPLELPAE